MIYPIVTTTFAHLFHTLVWLRPDIIAGGWREVARISIFLRLFQSAAFVFFMWKYKSDTTWWQLKAMFILIGQALNLSVYHKLGLEGVYYGSMYNKNVKVVGGWPFNCIRDPQYIGCLLTHQGVFLFYPYVECFLIHVYSMLWYVVAIGVEQLPQTPLKIKDI